MNTHEAIINSDEIAAIHHKFSGAKVVGHPSRSSAAQKLAGSGVLVFEGEMLEVPLSWHPAGLKH